MGRAHAASVALWKPPASRAARARTSSSSPELSTTAQGLTLVQFSAQRKRFVCDGGRI
jgi:hypothetical protein